MLSIFWKNWNRATDESPLKGYDMSPRGGSSIWTLKVEFHRPGFRCAKTPTLRGGIFIANRILKTTKPHRGLSGLTKLRMTSGRYKHSKWKKPDTARRWIKFDNFLIILVWFVIFSYVNTFYSRLNRTMGILSLWLETFFTLIILILFWIRDGTLLPAVLEAYRSLGQTGRT